MCLDLGTSVRADDLGGYAIADEKDWIKTDRTTLRVKGTENTWALGDTADWPINKAGSTAHFETPVIVEHIVADREWNAVALWSCQWPTHNRPTTHWY